MRTPRANPRAPAAGLRQAALLLCVLLLPSAAAPNADGICHREKADAWPPVDSYTGGAEHATGHLIYFRFIT
ncbi:MAG: hypothetical protein ACC662_01510, partial [Planctomycetota bacterium]